MSTSRLRTALTEGSLSLPEGRIAVLRPPAQFDMDALPREAVQVVHSFRPDVDAWEGAGYPVSRGIQGEIAVAVVVVPRAKALARAVLAEAAARADLVVVDGQKTDGVDSLYKACRQVLGDLPTLTKGHGRLFWFAGRTDQFDGWAVGEPVEGPHGYYTTAGVFSDGAVDPGSKLLAEALPEKLPARMADLGAGWGYLAVEVLKNPGVRSLDLIEAEALALDCARLNVTDPRARFHWADATRFAPEAPYDAIVMNPPFHQARAADVRLGQAFIAAARRMLTPNGKLWMVANRHLPYEAVLTESFRHVDMIGGSNAFKLFAASRPLR